MTWTPIFALPNLDLGEPIEGTDIALAAMTDPRVQQFADQHAAFKKFAGSFTDAFGVPLTPALILLRDSAPRGVDTAEAVAGFRDAVVAATVPISRARWMKSNTSFSGAHYSDVFDFHAWSLGRDNKSMVSSTPAQMAYHQVEKFRGQSSARLGISTLRSYDVDWPLMRSLLSRWHDRFQMPRPRREDVALFRSLGMANQAMKVAGDAAVQIYDFGRLTGLWTSAFETLMHPGGTAQIGARTVQKKLAGLPWERADLKQSRYYLRAGAGPVLDNSGKPVRVTLPALIYFQLSDARNAFLHGKDVSSKTLFLRPKGQALGNLAALLYRMALVEHIDLVWREPMPSMGDIEVWGEWYARHMAFFSPQSEIEDSISIAQIPAGRDGDTRDARRERIKARYKRKTGKATSPAPLPSTP